jgi:hypothetical protein
MLKVELVFAQTPGEVMSQDKMVIPGFKFVIIVFATDGFAIIPLPLIKFQLPRPSVGVFAIIGVAGKLAHTV